MDKREFEHLSDCCRPGEEDLADEQLQALAAAMDRDAGLREDWENQQAWNAAMGRLIRDVPVPDGLSDRILSQLESKSAPASEASAVMPREVVSQVQKTWLSWRRLTISAATVAAVLAVAVWLGPWSGSLGPDQVASMARGWVTNLDPEDWRSSEPPLESRPLDRVLWFPAVAWQPIEALGDPEAVVYRASIPPAQNVAYLFAIQTDLARDLPKIPPVNPDSTTGGLCLGVWKNGDIVYVLAVPGSRQRYQRMLSSGSFAVAIGEDSGRQRGDKSRA